MDYGYLNAIRPRALNRPNPYSRFADTPDPVRKPNGYFRSMIRKAESGDLHLHKSVFGILKRSK
jgi:hypothetical protein